MKADGDGFAAASNAGVVCADRTPILGKGNLRRRAKEVHMRGEAIYMQVIVWLAFLFAMGVKVAPPARLHEQEGYR